MILIYNIFRSLNLEKCEFYKTEIEFFGFIFSSNGISPSAEKIKAIKQLASPKNVNEIRSFLGMTNFLSRFIVGYSEISAPLRHLTKKDIPWKWDMHQEAAFNKLKASLSSNTVMNYFDPKKITTLITDAGPSGVSAILFQHTNDKDYRPVAYSSRSLSEVEQRYSQLEKECLAILHGCEKFRMYLVGDKFEVLTDHKPLVYLFNNPRSTIPLRIERWSLRLQTYNFSIKHIRGDLNPADYCSRHTSTDHQSIVCSVTETYVNWVAAHAAPVAVTLDEIRSCTKTDSTLQTVANMIKTNKWFTLNDTTPFKNCNVKELKIYRQIASELTVNHDQSLIFRSNRIVIPYSLRNRLVHIAHEGHLGICKTKSMMRDKIYFPGMDTLTETILKNCLACQAVARPDYPPPMNPSPLPPFPWHTLNIDFLGPLPNHSYLLVVIDQYSRFPEVEITGTTAAGPTLEALNKIFSTHGLPHKIISDNGSPFQSKEFKEYMKQKGISHHRITPLHPKANSAAENFMRNLNKTVRTAAIEQKPWKQALYDFLLNYRISVHTTTQVSPAEVLYGRKIRGKIPMVNTEPNYEKLAKLPENDERSKLKMKYYTDNRYHAKESCLAEGDFVLVRQRKLNKLTSNFDPVPYQIIRRRGSMITASRPNHLITRNIDHFKFLSKKQPPQFAQQNDSEYDFEFDPALENNHERAPTQGRVRKTYPRRLHRPPDYYHEG